MNSLLGDRFLKRFVGDIRRKEKHPNPITERQKDTDEEMVVGLDNDADQEAYGSKAADSQKTRHDSTTKTPEVGNE